MKEDRIEYLDSVRGLAALSVVVFHYIHSLERFNYWDKTKTADYLSILFNGADAVSLFFVLSGFVLSYRYLKSRNEPVKINYESYLVQRIARLYPAYLVMLVITFSYKWWGYLSFHFFYDAIVHHNQSFLAEALLIRGTHYAYTPGWTLGVEIAMSALVPAMVIVAIKAPRMIYWLLPVTLLLNMFMTIFVFHFLLGVLLAMNFNRVRDYDGSKSKWYPLRWVFYLVVIVLYSTRQINFISELGDYYRVPHKYIGLDFFHITGVASFFILCIIINNRLLQKILLWKPFLFLGRISYSLYLIHWFVIFSLFIPDPPRAAAFFHYKGNIFLFGPIFCVGVSIVFATVLYYVVEKPLHDYGKKISRRFRSEKSAITI